MAKEGVGVSEDRPISAWCWVKPKDGEVVPDYPPVPIRIIQVEGLYPELEHREGPDHE